MASRERNPFQDYKKNNGLPKAQNLSDKELFQGIFRIGMTVFCCVAIIVFGITFLTKANPITTSIGENINTNDLSVAGNATVGGTFDVVGDATFTGNSLVGGNLDVSGDITIGGNLNMAGNTSFASINTILYVDGVTYTKDSAGIQAAIEALPAEGGKIVLPEDIYPVSSAITFTKSNITLEGSGKNTILRLIDGFNADLQMLSDTGHSGIVITNLSVNANYANQTAGYVYGVVLSSTTSDSRIENCWFTGATSNRTNIESYANSTIISNCTFSGNHSNSTGLHLAGGRDVILSDNIFIGQFYLMYIQNSDNIAISGNSFYSGDIRLWNSTNCSIAGNKLRSSYVYLRSSSNNNTISGNSISNTGNYGIRLESSSYNTVAANAISGPTTAGIYFNNSSSYNVVDGNSIKTTTGLYGIQEAAATEDYNTISGNIIIGAATSALSTLGIHDSIYGNKTSNATEGLFDITTTFGAIQTALTITQNGTGDIVDFKDSSVSVFKITDGGNVVMTGNLTTPSINTILYVDGTTYARNSTGIQAAIDALPIGGGKVILPAGTYNVTATINITKSNITLEGVGEATILYLADGANQDVLVAGDGTNTYTGIKIANLKIDCNQTNQTTNYHRTIWFSKINYSMITNVFATNGKDYNVHIQSSNYNKIINNIISATSGTQHALWLSSGSQNNVVTGNSVFSNSSSYGISLANAYYNQITDNVVFSNSNSGIYLGSSTNNNVSSNSVYSNGRHGISLATSSYNTISANNLKDNSQLTTDTYNDIVLASASIRNVVSGNTIQANVAKKTHYGITESTATDDYNSIQNNIISGPISGDIQTFGIHTTVSGNKTSSATEGLFDIVSNSGATQTALTVTQNGTGDIVNFKDGAVSVFKITDGGNVIVSEINGVIYVDGNKYTQDSAGIQEAIDDLPSTGGKVILPAGTYNLDRAIDAAIADDGGVYATQTTAANESTTNDMALLPVSPEVNDAYYFGYDYRTRKITLNVGTAGIGTYTITWEYYNGSVWTGLSGITDNTAGFTVSGTNDITYTLPSDWVKSTVNGTEKYFIRARLSSFANLTVRPLGTQAYGYGSIIIDKSNVALEGVGEASKIYIVNNANVGGIYAGNASATYSNIRVYDLHIDGNISNNSSGFGGIYFNNINNSIIDKVYIYRTFRDGVFINNASDNIVSNSYIKNCGSGYGGLELYNSSHVLITGNHFEGNIYENLSFYGASYLRIIGNNIETSSRSGMYLYNVNNSTISGNIIQSNNYNGIRADDTFNYNTISDNTFYNNGQSANDTYSDIVLNYGTYNIISNNTIRAAAANKTKYGIYESSAVNADRNTIQDNTISGPVSGTVYAQGPRTTVSGNKTSSTSEGLFDISTSFSSTQTALTVTQNGTGDIINLKNSSATVFVITQDGRVGIGTASPDSSAALEISSTTGGFLPPRMTTAQRDAISSPVAGLVIYNTETNKLNVYNGASWETVTSTP